MRDIRMLIAALLVPTFVAITGTTAAWLLVRWRQGTGR
jgi:hypothetical protein